MSDTLVVIFGIVLASGTLLYLLNGGTMNLTAAQIGVFAQNAGFTGDDLVTAIAVALAESSGNPNAQGDKTPTNPNGTSYGLWQIHWTVHPEVGPPENLFDPQTNANAAFTVFQEQGWAAWSTFTNGMYQAHVSDAQAATGQQA